MKPAKQYYARIDLLITKVYMPKMEGHELERLVKEIKPSIRVLTISSPEEGNFLIGGCHDCAFLKPVTPELLTEQVTEL